MRRRGHASSFDCFQLIPFIGLLALISISLPDAAAGAGPGCAAKLTDAELVAVSPGAESMQAFERNPGHSECSWTVPGNGDPNTLSLTFWEPRSMADAILSADSPEDFFEMYVTSAEDVRGRKRETLKGVGQRSALFRDGDVRELYVLTKAGVAHFITDGLTDAQMTELGRAVAAP